MAGLLAGRIVMQSRLAALGPQSLSTPHGTLRGHAFHFSRFETSLVALTHARKHTGEPASAAHDKSAGDGEAVYRVGNLTASYFHAWFDACPRSTASLFLPSAAL